jgi:hypothetical protein
MKRGALVLKRNLLLLTLSFFVSIFLVLGVTPKVSHAGVTFTTIPVEPAIECQPAIAIAEQAGTYDACVECHPDATAPAPAPGQAPMMVYGSGPQATASQSGRVAPPDPLPEGYIVETYSYYYDNSPSYEKTFTLAYNPTAIVGEEAFNSISVRMADPLIQANIINFYYWYYINGVPGPLYYEDWNWGSYKDPDYTIYHTFETATDPADPANPPHEFKAIILHNMQNRPISFRWAETIIEWTVDVDEAATVEPTIEIVGYHSINPNNPRPEEQSTYISPLENYTMLKTNDIIVVKVTYPAGNTDPNVREMISFKASSSAESGEVLVYATESDVNSGVFYNYNPNDGDSPINIDPVDPLYIGAYSELLPKRVKIDDEEDILTVTLYDFPDVTDSVTLDVAEVGVGWFGDYDDNVILGKPFNSYPVDDFCPLPNIRRSQETAEGFYTKLRDDGWNDSFNNGDLDCKESHYDKLGDSGTNGIDTVDFGLWAGHGPSPNTNTLGVSPWSDYALHFYTTPIHSDIILPLFLYPDFDDHNLYRNEVEWGNTDLEWMALFTCSFLADSDPSKFGNKFAECANMGSDIRMILGFKDKMDMLPSKAMIEKFIWYMTRKKGRKTIKEAWLLTAAEDNRKKESWWYQGGTGVVIFDEAAETDHLPGYGGIAPGKTFTIDSYEEEI